MPECFVAWPLGIKLEIAKFDAVRVLEFTRDISFNVTKEVADFFDGSGGN